MLRGGEGLQVVDVRETWEAEICSIDGARLIPLGELPARAAEIDPAVPVLLVCHHGARSMQATMFLRAQGYDRAMNLAGGIDAWARQVDPAMATY
ncbi:MAG: sulfurtransferase [Alphaproteobacteria bacterium]|nr:sulfurtransferase [Alphaproteobacteria bacterium]